MTPVPHSLPGERAGPDRLGLVFALFALLLAPLGVLADKAVVPLVVAAVVGGGVAAGRTALPWRICGGGLAAAVGLLTAWWLVTSIWSFHPPQAAALALRVAVLLMALLYLAALAGRLEEPQRHWVRQAFGVGFAVAVLLLAIELAFGGPIFTLLQGPAASDYATYSRLNRGVSAVAILVWPLAILIWQRGQPWLAGALPPAVFGIALASQSSASAVALGAGLLAALLAGLGRPLAGAVMAVALVATLLASPFAAGLARQAGLADADWLAETAHYRLHIGSVVSDRIAERPLMGWGFDASPDLPAREAQPFRPGDKIIPSHPHNGALQIMVETGLVGSLLALGLLILVARRIDALPSAERAAAVAMMVTILGVAATAYGIWQSHWLAMIGAATVFFIAVQPAAQRPD